MTGQSPVSKEGEPVKDPRAQAEELDGPGDGQPRIMHGATPLNPARQSPLPDLKILKLFEGAGAPRADLPDEADGTASPTLTSSSLVSSIEAPVDPGVRVKEPVIPSRSAPDHSRRRVSRITPGDKTTKDPVSEFLEESARISRAEFSRHHHRLTFHEFLGQVVAHPERYIGHAGDYMRRTIEHFEHGQEPIIKRQLGREFQAFRIVNRSWDPEFLKQKSVLRGHDLAFHELHAHCRKMGKEPAPDKGILILGPAGTGKSMFFETLIEGMEVFSQSEEGVLVGICWLTDQGTVKSVASGGIGFNQNMNIQAPDEEKSVAFFRPSDPLFLLTPAARHRFLKDTLGYEPPYADGGSGTFIDTEGQRVPVNFNVDYFLRGTLDPFSKGMFKALLRHYDGDLARVYDHVRVVRWELCRDLGEGIVHQGPVSIPHAAIGSMGSSLEITGNAMGDILPKSGQELIVAEAPEIAANRGLYLIDDAFKGHTAPRYAYLLSGLEASRWLIRQGHRTVAIPSNSVKIFGANLEPTARFFAPNQEGAGPLRDRLVVILLSMISVCSEEAKVYRDNAQGPLARHADRTLSMFTCGTRVLKPNLENYDESVPEDVKQLIGKLSIMEKLLLLDDVPDHELNLFRDPDDQFTATEIKLLRGHARVIAEEYTKGVGEYRFAGYDGAQGYDTRKAESFLLRGLTDSAAGKPLDVLMVVKGLEDFLRAGNDHDVMVKLQQARLVEIEWKNENPGKEFKDADKSDLEKIRAKIRKDFPFASGDELLELTKQVARSLVSRDMHEALGMVSRPEAEAHVCRYVYHCMAQVNKQVRVKIPEKHREHAHSEGPSETILQKFEDGFATLKDRSDESRAQYRTRIVEAVNRFATRSENKDQNPMKFIEEIFSELVERVYKTQATKLKHYLTQFGEDLVRYQGATASPKDLQSKDKDVAARAKRYNEARRRLIKMGYPEDRVIAHYMFATRRSKS